MVLSPRRRRQQTILMPADETVCSFCGVSHLLYSEDKRKQKVIDVQEERIVLLEDHMTSLGLAVPPKAEGGVGSSASNGAAAAAANLQAAKKDAQSSSSNGSQDAKSKKQPTDAQAAKEAKEAKEASRAHQDQLAQMQESCNQRLKEVNDGAGQRGEVKESAGACESNRFIHRLGGRRPAAEVRAAAGSSCSRRGS